MEKAKNILEKEYKRLEKEHDDYIGAALRLQKEIVELERKKSQMNDYLKKAEVLSKTLNETYDALRELNGEIDE